MLIPTGNLPLINKNPVIFGKYNLNYLVKKGVITMVDWVTIRNL